MLDPVVAAQLSALRAEFIDRTHVEAEDLQQALMAFETAAARDTHAMQIKRLCHRLAGGLGTFGFHAVSTETLAYGRTVDPDANTARITQQGLALASKLRSLSLGDLSGGPD